MSRNGDYVAWANGGVVWTRDGYRLRAPLHDVIDERLAFECERELTRVLDWIGPNAAELVDRPPAGWAIQVTSPDLFSADPTKIRNSVEQAIHAAYTRVDDQVAYERGVGSEWLSNLRALAKKTHGAS